MCFQRKPTLGKYNSSRLTWRAAYRAARINIKYGREPDPALTGIRWKAELIVAYDRDGVDWLEIPAANRLESKHIIDSILSGMQ